MLRNLKYDADVVREFRANYKLWTQQVNHLVSVASRMDIVHTITVNTRSQSIVILTDHLGTECADHIRSKQNLSIDSAAIPLDMNCVQCYMAVYYNPYVRTWRNPFGNRVDVMFIHNMKQDIADKTKPDVLYWRR